MWLRQDRVEEAVAGDEMDAKEDGTETCALYSPLVPHASTSPLSQNP